MDVGVRELKQNLSEYLERASRGELIRVTDRGHPKAILGPIPGTPALERGIAEKWIRPARDVPPSSVRRQRAAQTVLQSLSDDRGS